MSYRPPYYKMYPQDYLSSPTTRRMSLAEHGLYRKLLDHAWLEEPTATLPADLSLLAKITGVDRRILSRFTVKYPGLFRESPDDSQRIYNVRQMAEYQEFLQSCEKKRLAGIESGKARQVQRTSVQQALNNIQSKKSDTEKEEEKKEGAPAPPSLSFSGQNFSVTTKQDAMLGEAFPWIDRPAEYRKADSWLEANPERRPKKTNRFLHNWFSRIAQPGEGSNGKLVSFAEKRSQKNADAIQRVLGRAEKASGDIRRALPPAHN